MPMSELEDRLIRMKVNVLLAELARSVPSVRISRSEVSGSLQRGSSMEAIFQSELRRVARPDVGPRGKRDAARRERASRRTGPTAREMIVVASILAAAACLAIWILERVTA